MVKKIGLAVTVSDCGAAANVGGGVESTVRIFDLPEEIAAYISKSRGAWKAVSLAIYEEE